MRAFSRHLAVALTRFSFAQNSDHVFARPTHPRAARSVSRRNLYLMVARTAVLRGKTEMARLARAGRGRLGATAPDGDRARL